MSGFIFGENNSNLNSRLFSTSTEEKKISLDKEEYMDLKKKAQSDVMNNVPMEYLGKYRDVKAKEEIRKSVRKTVENLYPDLNLQEKNNIIERLTNEINGFKVIDPFLDDEKISEILVERYDKISVEIDGEIHETDAKFDSEEDLYLTIERMITPLGRRLNWAEPTVNARLPDGSRISATHSRVAVDGCQLTIRKFRKDVTLDDLIRYGALNRKLADALIKCVKARLSIVFSGGTGTGKSTWMNALSPYIDPGLSIITIEDPCELQFNHPKVRRWEAQPPNIEGKGEITINHLVKHALRNRPDIIIIGEVRGSECFDFARANATGHKGSMTTIHADTPEEAGVTLVALTTSAGILNQEVSATYLAKGIDLIVQLQRMPDRSRKMVSIHEVVGAKGGNIITKPLVEFVQNGYQGKKVVGEWVVVNDDFSRAKTIREYGIEWDGWL